MDLVLSALAGAWVTWWFGLYYANKANLRQTRFEFQMRQSMTAILKGLEAMGAVQLSQERRDLLPVMIRVGGEDFFPVNVAVASRAWWNKGPVAWLWDHYLEGVIAKRTSRKPRD